MRKSFPLALFLSSVIALPAVADDVFSVPFVEDFDKNTHSDLFTTIDANNDGVTIKRHYQTSIMPGWFPDKDYHEMEYNSGGATKKADDWYITPKIHLEAGKVYSFSMDGYVSYDSFVQLMEVKIGQGTKATSMTSTLMATQTISDSSPRTFENEFMVEKDGDYNIGMHVISEADHATLYFGNIKVKQASDDNAPAQINDLKVTPEASGKLSATLSFTAPSKTIGGAELASLTKIEISRNGNLIKTLTEITPGQVVEYVDNGPQNGRNTYMVVAYNEKGKSIRTLAENIYVGIDRPLPPTGFTLLDGGNEIILSWDVVSKKGVNGIVVDPSSVTYVVDALNSSYSSTQELTRTSDTSYRYTFNTNEGEQDLKRFGIRAFNAADWSDYAYARMVIGRPYNLPYRESFATGSNHGLNWQEGDGTYYVTTAEAADGDAGCAMFTPRFKGDQVSFNLGKMNMRLVQNPVMKFSYKGLTEQDKITVLGVRQDGTSIELAVLQGKTPDWTSTTVDLRPFKGQNYVIPKFVTTGTAGHPICLDDIQILDLYDYDLSLQIAATVNDENKADVALTITNEGMHRLSDYEILLSVGGKEVKRMPAGEEVQAGHVVTTNTEIDLNGQSEESVEIKGQLVCLYDLNPSNDQASVQVLCKRNVLEGNDEASSVNSLSVTKPVSDILTVDGRRVRRNAHSSSGLKKGIYIIDGKKVCVTE